LSVPLVQNSLGRTGDQLLAAAGVILAAAAVYFLCILYFVEKSSCPYCLGLHLAGLTVGTLLLTDAVSKQRSGGRGILEAAALTGFMAMCVLSAGQKWGPKPETHLITSGGLLPPPVDPIQPKIPAATTPGNPASVTTPAPPAPAGRVVSFFDGALKYDVSSLPLLGPANAPVVLVEFFDYTCNSCRTLAGDLKALKQKWPNSFAVIALPTPLNRNCNPYLKEAVHDHPGACELAKLSLSLWRANPTVFPGFHEYLLSVPVPVTPESIVAARRMADGLVGANAMAAAMNDVWVDGQLRSNLVTFQQLTEKSIAMPKLLVHSIIAWHGIAKNTETFIRDIEQQFDLRGNGAPIIAKPQ
jgi:thiol-disulfide isomerase/thioredoxin